MFASAAQAETYPSRPIRLIVPYSAGSGADITARQTMAKLSEFLGQNIIIENRPGTSAIIGTDAVAKAAPDGYTLLFGVTQHAINPTLQPKLPYDTLNDFVPVARVTDQPLYMGVNTAVPGQSVAEVSAHFKANPGKYNYASTGIGTSIHLAGAYYAWKAGLEMSHIPYTNASQTLVDLGRNEIQVLFYTYQPLTPQVQAGRIKNSRQHRRHAIGMGAGDPDHGGSRRAGLCDAGVARRSCAGQNAEGDRRHS